MKIDRVLKAKGITKTALAEKLGTQKQNVNTLLRNPTETTINRIASALGVEAWELLCDDCHGGGAPQIICPKCGAALSLTVSENK